MKGRGRWIIGGLLALAAVVFLVRDMLPRPEVAARGEAPVARIKRVVPASDRVRVEVLNGTSTRGLARRATAAMRDAGFDVVSSGNATERPDSSLVIVRTGREAGPRSRRRRWAGRGSSCAPTRHATSISRS